MATSGPKWNSYRTLTAPVALLELSGDHLRQRGIGDDDPDALPFVAPLGEPLDHARDRRQTDAERRPQGR